MTALAKSDLDLSYKDLQGIVIPKADLSRSNIQSSKFCYSDLQGVKFYKSNLTNVDLSYCNLIDV